MTRSTARLTLGACLVALVASGCGGDPSSAAGGPVERVLVVSMPGVSWRDVDDDTMPALAAFAGEAALGDVSTRIGRRSAEPVTAYLTIGSGTRAVAPEVDPGVAVDAGENYGRVDAGELLLRRLGEIPDGIAYLALGAARDANDRSAFGADVGLLGDALDEVGVDRAIIANADEVEGIENDPPEEGAYRRAAATALMGSDGRVPSGTVARDLLLHDPAAPFGRRLDVDQVLDAFREAWPASGRGVVLAEASDLVRAASYAPRSTPAQRRSMRDAALRGADALLERLLQEVDPASDAVLVISPVAPAGEPQLGIAALRAPGVPAGLLRSATTRRDGYVQLADVTPTILRLLGEAEPDEIEGRAFRATQADVDGRATSLVEAAEAASFRDRIVALVTVAFIAVLALLTLGAWQRDRLGRLGRAGLQVGAYAVLGAAAGTYLVALLDPPVTSLGVYALALVGVGALVACVASLAERARRGSGPLVAVSCVVAVIGLDVLAGAPLQVNTVFGYSVAVAGRFAGLGNLAFALFGSAAVLLAALLADRYGERGRLAGVALLAAVLVVEGLPMLGGDVGGVLAMVPAFSVTAWLLAGRRLRPRHLAAFLLAAGPAVLVFAFIDWLRPDASQTHLARLAEQLLDGRWASFLSTLGRRWQASFGGTEAGAWAAIGIAAAIVVGYVLLVQLRHMGPGATRREWHRPSLAAAAGLGTLASLGLIANDSSFAVPATMLIIAAPVVIDRRARHVEPPAAAAS